MCQFVVKILRASSCLFVEKNSIAGSELFFYNQSMSQNPLNLLMHFILELLALYALGYWGWQQPAGAMRWLLGIGLPVGAAIVWGAFRARESQHAGKGLVVIPGALRLLLEILFFGGATWALCIAGQQTWAFILGAVVLLHYILSYDRLIELLGNSS